jgi:K+-transporting ATPase ATPase B chain
MATSTVPEPPPPAPARHPRVDETLIPKKLVRARPLTDPEILRRALKDSVLKLNPVTLMRNPVIFVVEVGAALVLVFLIRDLLAGTGAIGFELQIDLWLWFTVLFATFAEAMAEARGKAQAESLRKTKTETIANRLVGDRMEQVPSSKLRAGDDSW